MFEEITQVYLKFCAFGDFCDLVERKCPCLFGMYLKAKSWNQYGFALAISCFIPIHP